MPAIIPARLKQQAALLAEYFYEPSAFVRSLHHLMGAYSEGVVRSGQAGTPAPLMPTYRVRPQVLRQIVLELAPLVEESPSGGLALCDELWEQIYLEFRILAISLLGHIPGMPSEPIEERILSWVEERPGTQMVDLLFQQGMTRIRKENSKALLDLGEVWLRSADVYYQSLGLRCLLPSAESYDFDNIPLVLRLLQPFIRTAPSSLRPDILDILAVLARRSPQELALFLRQTLSMPNTDTPWFIRHCLKDLPSEIQDRLRQALREAERSSSKRDYETLS